MGCSWFNTETNKRKTSINNKNTHQIRRYETKSPAKNLQISSCSIGTLSHVWHDVLVMGKLFYTHVWLTNNGCKDPEVR